MSTLSMPSSDGGTYRSPYASSSTFSSSSSSSEHAGSNEEPEAPSHFPSWMADQSFDEGSLEDSTESQAKAHIFLVEFTDNMMLPSALERKKGVTKSERRIDASQQSASASSSSSSSLSQQPHAKDEDDEANALDDPEAPVLHKVVQAIIACIKRIVFSDPRDLIGVALMGTTKMEKNPFQHPHVHCFMPLQPPSRAAIKQVASLLEEQVREEIGLGSIQHLELLSAIDTACNMFMPPQANMSKKKRGGGGSHSRFSRFHRPRADEQQQQTEADDGAEAEEEGMKDEPARVEEYIVNAKNMSKRVMLFTACDLPPSLDKQPAKVAALQQRLNELDASGIMFMLYWFSPRSSAFDVTRLYSKVLPLGEEDDRIEAADGGQHSKGLSELVDSVLRKMNKKRTLGSLTWQLTTASAISTKVYCLLRIATKETPIRLDPTTQQVLKTETKLQTEQGQLADSSEVIKFHEFGTNKAIFTKDEVRRIKECSPQGLQLLGFKPLSHLMTPTYNLRPSYYLQPDDTKINGSSRAFHALVKQCHLKQRVPIVRITYRKSSAPHLAALLPQLPEGEEQHLGTGFHLIYLPFSDDIRRVAQHPVPLEAQPELKEACRNVITHFTTRDFHSVQVSNLALQNHYALIESTALDEKPREIKDTLQPRERHLKRVDPYLGDLHSLLEEALDPGVRDDDEEDEDEEPAPRAKAPRAKAARGKAATSKAAKGKAAKGKAAKSKVKKEDEEDEDEEAEVKAKVGSKRARR